MSASRITHRVYSLGTLAALAITCGLTGCSSDRSERPSEMTSYSSQASKSATPELFTIPQD